MRNGLPVFSRATFGLLAAAIAGIASSMPSFGSRQTNERKNVGFRTETRPGRAGRMTVAQNRRQAKKVQNVRRNRLAHR